MLVRNAAVPAANFGGGFSMTLFFIGLMMHATVLIWAGIGLFACVVFFQLVNLPVEIDASNRAKRQLVSLGIVDEQGMGYVRSVLNAAALDLCGRNVASRDDVALLRVESQRAAKLSCSEAHQTGGSWGRFWQNQWHTNAAPMRVESLSPRAGMLQRQPGPVLMAAGHGLLNEVHPLDPVVDVRIDRVDPLERFAGGAGAMSSKAKR